MATTLGTASFTFGGVTYASSGTLLPTSTDNDFLFSSAGALIGEIVTATNGTASVVAGVPQGWTIKTGGGGGTMNAPEIDPGSSFAAVTLLAGLLAVMRGGRRTLRMSHSPRRSPTNGRGIWWAVYPPHSQLNLLILRQIKNLDS